MKWFTDYVRPKIKKFIGRSIDINDNWITCKQCQAVMQADEFKKSFNTCNNCENHEYISSKERLNMLLDQYEFINVENETEDPIEFTDLVPYTERLNEARKNANESSTLVHGTIDNHKLTVLCMDFKFMGGSMGVYTGNAFIKGALHSIENQIPYVVITSSGGARMQEGIHALMQMPRTVLYVNKLKHSQIPYIVVLTYPTMGGVSASFAGLGDITIAEKGALVGFTGRRVIENTIKVDLPNDFQTSQFQLDHGMVDKVVHRKDLKKNISNLLSILTKR